MKKVSALSFILLCVSMLSFSQTEEFEPGGKPFMKIFSNYQATFSDGETNSAFELKRVYLGYEYNFSENFSAKANLDVGDPGVGNLQMTAYVKNAYVKYNEGDFSVSFGLISTTQFKVQEKYWGYRYMAKSFQDEFRFNSSADLGLSAAYNFSEAISTDLIIANGEGYKQLQADSTLRYGLGVTLTPVKKITGRVYYDFSTNEETQSSIVTFLGYADDVFSMGAEYNKMLNYQFNDGQDRTGTSFYATVRANNKLKFFMRYDNLSSNKLDGETENWDIGNDGQWIIAGLEYSPVRGVKIAPNYRGWNPEDSNKAFSSTLMFNFEIKF